LLLEGDDDSSQSGQPVDVNNWPDVMDNHGKDGGNLTFCDGHAEWVGRRRWDFVLNTGQNGESLHTP
jgi:prepilin-type processing-associated H-X9-DG protein